MPFKLLKFLEHFMIDTFLIKLTQLEKTGSIGKVFSSWVNVIKKESIIKCSISTFETRNCSELNSKSAYIPKCIHNKCINMYEYTTVVIRAF